MSSPGPEVGQARLMGHAVVIGPGGMMLWAGHTRGSPLQTERGQLLNITKKFFPESVLAQVLQKRGGCSRPGWMGLVGGVPARTGAGRRWASGLLH